MSEFLAFFISTLLRILLFAIVARAILSWFNVGPSSPFYPIANVVYQITEPLLAPIRRVLPKLGMLDFSPMVAIIIISILLAIF